MRRHEEHWEEDGLAHLKTTLKRIGNDWSISIMVVQVTKDDVAADIKTIYYRIIIL